MKFIKVFWAALLAFVVANIIMTVFGIMVLAGFVAAFGGSSTVPVDRGSILLIDLSEAIYDSPPSDPMLMLDLKKMKVATSTTLFDAVTAIDAASVDDKIEGIYITGTLGSAMSLTKAEELRRSIAEFKQSGKFVIAYAPVYSQTDYYLCSVADKILMNPEGGMEWRGLSGGVMFYKGLMDKLGIEPIVLRHGTFKAAVEPFITDKMSAENRLQTSTLYNSIWTNMVSEIAASRPAVDSATLQKYASELTITLPSVATELKMVDSLLYNDGVKSLLGNLCSMEGDDIDLKFVSLSSYAAYARANVSRISKNKIAILYAEGTIVDGEGGEGNLGGETLAAKVVKLRNDKKVKAVVLRVNSPGGSALASEIMWRELELLKKEKPLIISMGSVAASGGYYIAAPGDVILSNRATITGSIGVFGLLFNAQKALKDKLGVTVEMVTTNPSADMGTPFRSITPAERAYIMTGVEQVYKTFTTHVAQGRNMTPEQVDAIGGGRVWSGVDAQRIGLVDGFGGLREAIALAADRAEIIDDFRAFEVIDEDGFAAIINSFRGASTKSIEAELGEFYSQYRAISKVLNAKGVQALMPYSFEF